MATIQDILKESDFFGWSSAEQQALYSMMRNVAAGRSVEGIVSRTERVCETFVLILDTHLPTPPDKEKPDDVD
jgi:hypothetical protein